MNATSRHLIAFTISVHESICLELKIRLSYGWNVRNFLGRLNFHMSRFRESLIEAGAGNHAFRCWQHPSFLRGWQNFLRSTDGGGLI